MPTPDYFDLNSKKKQNNLTPQGRKEYIVCSDMSIKDVRVMCREYQVLAVVVWLYCFLLISSTEVVETVAVVKALGGYVL